MKLPREKVDRLNATIGALNTERMSWTGHWAELAKFVLPRRYRWLVSPNQNNRGSSINGSIIDSTGTIAARVLAAGMMSGITSPTRPWFKLRIASSPRDEINPTNLWLAECEKRMQTVFAESNFYNSIAVMYLDLAVFGTSPMIVYEDFDDVINCVNPCAGEYFVGNDAKLRVDPFARGFLMNIKQMVEEFGEENVSQEIRRLHKEKGSYTGKRVEKVIYHLIEKNNEGMVPSHFKWVEYYWEKDVQADDSDKFPMLRVKGFIDQPFISPRWDVTSNDAYGRSPAMDALGDIKQLQQETKRKAQAIDKLANPPMVADVELKNQPASTLPGGVTYVSRNGDKGNVGFRPAYENFRPPIQEIMADIKEVQERIKAIFFNDLFLMISNLNTVRSATEIDARREEKLVMLGPVLERIQDEGLDPIIDRVFGIMWRGGLFPPPPPEVQGQFIKVEYVSMLAEAQRAVSTGGIERLVAQAGSLAAVRPDVLDNIDFDEGIREYGMLLGVSPKLLKASAQVQQERQARAQQQQDMQDAALTKEAVSGAKVLSETDVGGGKGALEAMLGGASI